ncbi:MAG: hypothetical protein C5B56_15365 [Proteobacteria bacterium]|nr:MAG: hypothetical protein C5B56_15365 [Pseudomonadota bacterium]
MTSFAGFRSVAPSMVAAVAAAWTVPALAQQPPTAPPIVSPPIFSWDLTVGWIGMGEFRPVAGKVPPLTNDPKYPYVPNGQGRQPTYRIADLTNPNLKPWVKEVMKKDNDEVIAGKIAFTPSQSCLPAGVPGFMALGGNNNPVWFLQSPKEARIMRAADSQVRRVALDVPHSANPTPSWYGESVGHYEGDTLVIDTIALSTKTFVDAYRTPHTEKLHVIERWRMVDDRKFMEATFMVEDPDTYYEPWWGMRRYRRVARQFEEEICAENNQQLFDYKIPTADRPDF